MMHQADLLLVQSPPRLDVARFEGWPIPGLTPIETAQSALAQSREFKAAIAAAILSGPATLVTEAMVRAALPQDWKDTLGRFFHAGLCAREGEEHGIHVKYVPHDGGGYHYEYRAMQVRHA
ncbi:hypothetical protein K2O51_31110 (plasmid) [Cupriavidus pinatubonensis]|uniref:hypothetical protein n=1 Tax=Cupriavidus pinatubonensis TaxID=248026 RepID=UPI001C732F04|nr:hypothetical protein [Cupriavidus pinatubonensis]QYY33696.1 hypothetical protein K2O51_31110 [Cupriavidus pinatubonensis]